MWGSRGALSFHFSEDAIWGLHKRKSAEIQKIREGSGLTNQQLFSLEACICTSGHVYRGLIFSCFAWWCKSRRDEASCIFWVRITHRMTRWAKWSFTPSLRFVWLGVISSSVRCFWTDSSHSSFSLAFLPFMQRCRIIHIPTTELLEKKGHRRPFS